MRESKRFVRRASVTSIGNGKPKQKMEKNWDCRIMPILRRREKERAHGVSIDDLPRRSDGNIRPYRL